MQFTLSVNLDNETFSNPLELPNILLSCTAKIQEELITVNALHDMTGRKFPLLDSNGNTVGEARFTRS